MTDDSPNAQPIVQERLLPVADIVIDKDLQVRLDLALRAAELAEDIKVNGLRTKPECYLDAESRPHLYKGFTRLAAIKLLGWGTVKVDIVDVDPKEAASLGLTDNRARADFSPIEEALAFKAALGRGWTLKPLASKQRVTFSYIENRIKLLELPKSVRELVHRGKLHVETAYELLAMPTEQLKEESARYIVSNRESLAEAKRHIRNEIHEYEQHQKLVKVIEKAERKTCPDCKRAAFKLLDGYPLDTAELKKGPWVSCQEHAYGDIHIWNPTTGQSLGSYRQALRAKEIKTGKVKKTKAVNRVMRCPVPVEIIGPALIQWGIERAKQELKRKIKHDVKFSLDGIHVEISTDNTDHASLNVWAYADDDDGMIYDDDKVEITIHAEAKQYRDKGKNLTKINGGDSGNQESVDKTNAKIKRFLKALPLVEDYLKGTKTQKRIA